MTPSAVTEMDHSRIPELRIITAGVATGIPLSVWFLAFSIFLFFSLAAMKRQAKLVSAAETAPLWGICLLLLYWISRMVMITHRGWMDDDPVVFAARDKISIACAALVVVLAVAGTLM